MNMDALTRTWQHDPLNNVLTSYTSKTDIPLMAPVLSINAQQVVRVVVVVVADKPQVVVSMIGRPVLSSGRCGLFDCSLQIDNPQPQRCRRLRGKLCDFFYLVLFFSSSHLFFHPLSRSLLP